MPPSLVDSFPFTELCSIPEDETANGARATLAYNMQSQG